MTFVSYALWPLLTLLIVALWFAATLDIVLHSGGEATNAKLLCMTVLVSVVAVAAVASIGGVFGGQYFDTAARTNPDGVGKQDPDRAYLFSFGLEHASSVTPAKSTAPEKQTRHN